MHRWLRILVPHLLIIALLAGHASGQERQIIAFGDFFPEIELQAPKEAGARDYLGISEADFFTPSQVKADLLLVELLNVHCPHCQMQAPSYNELFKLLEANPETRGRIKMLAIAVGNLPGEVKAFKAGYQVNFPIIADSRFAAHRALGGSSTPFSIYLRQDLPGRPGVVAGTHHGLNTHYQNLFEELRSLASEEVAELRSQGMAAQKVSKAIEPLFTNKELELRVRKALIRAGGMIVDFSKVELRSGRRVYSALMERGQTRQRLFAEVTSRMSVCDICHDVHFIYVFDASGQVVGFEPLQLTKYGNVNWNAKEVSKMRERVVGKYLTAPPPFDPRVDAVTSATMTSAIIFDSLSLGEDLLQELRAKGLM